MKRPFVRFLVSWFVCALGLWISAGLLGGKITYGNQIGVMIIAGFLLAIVNIFIRPLLVIFSLPAILFSLGLFMIVINGLMVLLVATVYKPLQISGFGPAMLAGIVIGLVNFLVSTILEDK